MSTGRSREWTVVTRCPSRRTETLRWSAQPLSAPPTGAWWMPTRCLPVTRMISQLGGTRTSNTTAVPCDGKTDGSTTATDNSRPGDGLFRMLVDSANAGVGPEEVASG
ncbi:hypothetical protein [Streptomyces acidicola]|uniref:hypothetical protein n=1 Tax=Streptomyces acidicola TaxID=2596892 RepID=UPI00343EF7E5